MTFAHVGHQFVWHSEEWFGRYGSFSEGEQKQLFICLIWISTWGNQPTNALLICGVKKGVETFVYITELAVIRILGTAS